MKKLLSLLLFLPVLCFSQIVINDLPSGGAIGTAANTVNKGSLFHINQTTNGQTLSVPNPTATNFSKFIYVLDIGTASFALSPGGNLTPGTGVILVWTGTNWNVAGNGSPPTGSVTQSITNGDIDHSPSGDAVYDALALKENSITSGTTLQYWRGDKTFQTLDKNAVGLGNVDNTSDLNKPVSTAQAAADALKVTANASITGATKAKITYDSKGLVTSGEDLLASDIPSLTASKISDLGNSATKNVGTTSGTVAAGDDSRFDNATTPVVFHDDGGYNRNPADAATYYLKTHITQAAVTTSSQGDGVRFRCPRNLTFVAAQINSMFTSGSSENTTFTINNVTAGTSVTITNTANYSSSFSTNHSFTFSCSANDYIEVRMVCPAWATNPTVLNQIVTIYYR